MTVVYCVTVVLPLIAIFHRLSVDDEMVYLDAQGLILPKKAVPKVLKMLHSGHWGITKTFEMARLLYYWPGMYNDIVQIIQNCAVCGQFRASQAHAPRSTDPPSTNSGPPMQHVGLDMCKYGGSSSWCVSIIGAVILYSAK